MDIRSDPQRPSQAAGPAERAKQAVRDEMERVSEAGKDQLQSAKSAAAEKTERLGGTPGRVEQKLDREGEPTLASYAAEVGSGLSSFADKLRNANIDELATQARQLARQNPALFIAASVGLGFALARFLKASPRREGDVPGSHGESEGNPG